MKMLMIIIDESKKEELEAFLSQSGVAGYTEIAHAAGAGSTGPRLGSGAFPRTSAVVFTMLSEAALSGVVAGIEEFCATCGERLKLVTWDVEVVR